MTDTITTDTTPTQSEPITAQDWQAVIDIIDNPFIKPSELEQALLEMGYRLIKA